VSDAEIVPKWDIPVSIPDIQDEDHRRFCPRCPETGQEENPAKEPSTKQRTKKEK
jgi:hypothetical protein